MKVLVTTVPFGSKNSLPLEILERAGLDVVINPYNRKVTPDELCGLVKDVDFLIAGTEKISREALLGAKKLKLISRVGIGLDGIDLNFSKSLGIKVSYTPEAPSPAVAELTIGLLLSLIRGISSADRNLRQGNWNRIFGRRIADLTIGVIGVGRIGGRVIRRLSAFGSPRILVNDLVRNDSITDKLKIEWVSKKHLIEESDVVSLHVPLTRKTIDLIGADELAAMKKSAFLINTARGGIVNEEALAAALQNEKIAGAAIDVFVNEPYTGALTNTPNTILTCHMGSMTDDCRVLMEIQACEEVERFVRGAALLHEVPPDEYEIQRI